MPGLSPKLPVTRDPDDGFSLNKTFKELAIQNFKNLMLTSPGERMMDPQFGVGLRRFLFEQLMPFTFDDIQDAILEQVNIYMPYIQIVDIFIDTPPGEQFENFMGIRVEYIITPLNESAALDVMFDGTSLQAIG